MSQLNQVPDSQNQNIQPPSKIKQAIRLRKIQAIKANNILDNWERITQVGQAIDQLSLSRKDITPITPINPKIIKIGQDISKMTDARAKAA